MKCPAPVQFKLTAALVNNSVPVIYSSISVLAKFSKRWLLGSARIKPWGTLNYLLRLVGSLQVLTSLSSWIVVFLWLHYQLLPLYFHLARYIYTLKREARLPCNEYGFCPLYAQKGASWFGSNSHLVIILHT